MTKRIFMIFIFILLFFGVTKVQALSENEEINLEGERITELDGVIEAQEISGLWSDFTLTKYSKNRNVCI